MEEVKESFFATVNAIRKNALKENIDITNEQIANGLDIAAGLFQEYYDHDNVTPELLSKLREIYAEFIGPYQYFKITFIDEVDVIDPPTPPLESA